MTKKISAFAKQQTVKLSKNNRSTSVRVPHAEAQSPTYMGTISLCFSARYKLPLRATVTMRSSRQRNNSNVERLKMAALAAAAALN